MTKDEAKSLIVSTIVERQGLKATELASVPDLVLSGWEVPELVDELVRDGQLVEVEYVLPYMDWRVKSFLLPPGTKVGVNNHESLSGAVQQGQDG